MPTDEKDKTEITVIVETKSNGNVLAIGIAILLGLIILVIASDDGVGGLLGGSNSDIQGNCADGIDNDGGGQADHDDPDCYVQNNYNPEGSESNPNNDPLGAP
jgi:hypothetical protein